MLIQIGSDINAVGDKGELEPIQSLAEHMVNIYSIYVGSTPLLKSTHLRNLMIVRVLIEKGADFNHKDSIGRTPLMIVAGPGKQNMCSNVHLSFH